MALLDHGHWGCKLHRSNDGGKWEEIAAPKYPEGEEVKEGTPAVTKYLWAFSNAGRDKPGEILAFDTTTGNLYLSNDLGENWECLSSNLPMVHSVEFV